jgi:hypothetical protein
VACLAMLNTQAAGTGIASLWVVELQCECHWFASPLAVLSGTHACRRPAALTLGRELLVVADHVVWDRKVLAVHGHQEEGHTGDVKDLGW